MKIKSILFSGIMLSVFLIFQAAADNLISNPLNLCLTANKQVGTYQGTLQNINSPYNFLAVYAMLDTQPPFYSAIRLIDLGDIYADLFSDGAVDLSPGLDSFATLLLNAQAYPDIVVTPLSTNGFSLHFVPTNGLFYQTTDLNVEYIPGKFSPFQLETLDADYRGTISCLAG